MSNTVLLGEVGAVISDLDPQSLTTARLVGAVSTCGFMHEATRETLPKVDDESTLSNN